ncbi:MAG: IS66 family transposase [Dehalococcoidia bacterium]
MLLPDLDPASIVDDRLRAAVVELLNVVEMVTAELREARAEIQRLRDENNRLKGEQGKPDIKANTKAHPAGPPATDHSSERERHTPKPWTKRGKCATLPVDREEVGAIDPATLPPAAVFKGYQDVIVQDLLLRPDTIRFRKQQWSAPSTKLSYLAPLPAGFTGQFGLGVRTLALQWYYAGQMSEPKILELFHSVGVQISAGSLSNLLIQDQDAFHAEKAALYRAGLASSPWQHSDDTSTRVAGQNWVCHRVCNPLYTAYFTLAGKDRLSVIDGLRDLQPRAYRLNAEALQSLASTQLAAKTRRVLARLVAEQDLDEAGLTALLASHLPGLGSQAQQWIRDATAVAAYHAMLGFPVVQLLLCDDAPQFRSVTADLALCWIHEARHYKQLSPYVPAHRGRLDQFQTRLWNYYRELLAYRAQPTAADAVRLAAAFDTVFATTTGYAALDGRIAATRANKAWLLLVLQHPEIPLHNNPAELGARQRVRKRDVSFGLQSDTGRRCWDTFGSLVETAKKLGVSIHAYFADRVRHAGIVPRLDALITQQAAALNLGASWPAAPSTVSY